MYVPKWLKEKGCKGFEYQFRGKGPKHWIPDVDDPIFQDTHFRLIEKLGKRYDGHPDLSLPSLKTRLAIIDVYCESFPNTPKVMLIGGEEGMRYAISKGCGWRAWNTIHAFLSSQC